MITIYVCDSNEQSRSQLLEYSAQLETGLHLPVTTQGFASGAELLEHMSPSVDIVLLEGELSDMSGIECARRIRSNNASVMIIFVTAKLSCAADSYRVRAYDFLVKPVGFGRFSQTLTEAILQLDQNDSDHITFRTPTQWVRLPMHSILFVESARNKAVIHTLLSKYELYISMKEVEALLDKERFFRCHAGYIVNLSSVTIVDGSTAMMLTGDVVFVSKYRRKAFLEQLARYNHKDEASENTQ